MNKVWEPTWAWNVMINIHRTCGYPVSSRYYLKWRFEFSNNWGWCPGIKPFNMTWSFLLLYSVINETWRFQNNFERPIIQYRDFCFLCEPARQSLIVTQAVNYWSCDSEKSYLKAQLKLKSVLDWTENSETEGIHDSINFLKCLIICCGVSTRRIFR